VILSTVEMHTGGEPTRIVVGGWPRFSGKTLLDKRREARERFDHLRRGLMLEPRGHDGMYGALLVEPDHPEADLAVLFMHNEGYSTMCGHATIALARWAVDSGRVPKRDPETPGSETIVRLQCPCGLVTARVAADGTVRFESVPAFAYALDRIAPTRTWGPVTVDIAYGGAFYAFLSADSIGLDLLASPMRAIVDAGEEIAQAAAKAVPIEHADEPDLAFLYGTILTDGGNGADRPSRNVCIFAGRQIDRSPTGSGVTARMALLMARREARVGDERRFESCTGAVFSGRVVREAAPVVGRRSVIVEVGGRAHQTGEARFRFDDDDDPLREGFSLGL
jgi:proline racemase